MIVIENCAEFRKVFLVILALALLSVPVYSFPNIQNAAVTPNNAYIGESISLSYACLTPLAIQGARASITGPNVIIPDIQLPGGPAYSLSLDQAYIDRTGSFDATVFCSDSDGEANATINFNVSKITGGILDINPKPLYANDLMDILFEIKKDGSPIINNVNFSLFIDGQPTTQKSIVYDTTKGWIIRANAPGSGGTYNIKVLSTYSRVSLESESTVSVKAPIEFAIATVDKQSVVAGDNLTMTIRAFDKGNFIKLTSSNIKTYFDSNEISASSITDDGTNSYVRIVVPNYEKKIYTLKATFVYKNNTYQSTTSIGYIVPAEGEFIDDKPISVVLRFLRSGTEKLKMTTDSAGKYYGSIVPDTYELEIKFPETTLILEDVDIDNFDDPVDYSVAKDVHIEGINTKAVYYFSSSLPYDRAKIELPYREYYGNSDARILRCLNWNKQEKKCNISWTEASGSISKNGEKVELDVSSLGAFAIGVKEKAIVNFNIDRTTYNLKELVKIRGNVQDSQKKPISNVRIDVRVGSNVIGNINADSNGVFSIDFFAPDVEGDYTVTVYAEKQPYTKGENSKTFTVVKSRSISILFPEVIRLQPGQQAEKEITLINTGQDDLVGAQLSLSGIPEEYFALSRTSIDLPISAQDSVTVLFVLPEDAPVTTYGGTIRLSSGDFVRENSFGLTIEKEEITPREVVTSPATGFAIGMPSIDQGYIYLVLFALVLFSLAFIAKKIKKRRNRQRSGVDINTLSDIKNSFKSHDVRNKDLEEIRGMFVQKETKK